MAVGLDLAGKLGHDSTHSSLVQGAGDEGVHEVLQSRDLVKIILSSCSLGLWLRGGTLHRCCRIRKFIRIQILFGLLGNILLTRESQLDQLLVLPESLEGSCDAREQFAHDLHVRPQAAVDVGSSSGLGRKSRNEMTTT